VERATELLKKTIVIACRILDNENIMDELGHFSARIPNTDHILINGKVSPGRATLADIITVDLNGKKIAGTLEASSETPLHLSIYKKRADVMAIAHTHSPMVVTLSTLGIRLRPLHNTGASVFSEELPIYKKYGLIDSTSTADEVATLIGNHPSVILKGHGNVVVGGSIEECCLAAIWIEKAAAIQYQAMAIGVPHWLPSETAESIRKQFLDGKALKRSWDYFEWRATK